MRRPLIAGNWKMNLDRAGSVELASALTSVPAEDVDILVCPPSCYLDAVLGSTNGSNVHVGAQNAYFEPKGAFTGEVSLPMLKDLGCSHVILGHSERRQVFGECNDLINKKTLAALEIGLIPVVCVGETLEDREAGRTMEVVKDQVSGSLANLTEDQALKTVIAYEPVWAIGTGKTATPEQAQEVHADLRKILESRYNSESAAKIRILYGGSVKPANAEALMSQADIDGALVGGASLDAESFAAIIHAAGGVKN